MLNSNYIATIEQKIKTVMNDKNRDVKKKFKLIKLKTRPDFKIYYSK
jgi:hypothetical protein